MAATDFYKLKPEEKLDIFQQIGNEKGIPVSVVEKDWWVVQTLALIMEMDVSKHLVFKGGTSLSKGWDLIKRFSEDIDMALDRSFLGFSEGHMSVKKVKKLRKASREYIKETFFPELEQKFKDAGYNDVVLGIAESKDPNPEPIQIEISYPKVTEPSAYAKPGVVLEMGSRSLREPYSNREIASFIWELYPDQPFADTPIDVLTVNPERTFLEKIFLLHEEFQKTKDKIRIERLSRHIYDIEKLMDTEYADKALSDKKLYNDIISHRKVFSKIGNIDYDLHQPETVNPIPIDEVRDDWEKDYQAMSEEMIYGDALSFNKLLDRVAELKERINKNRWPPA